MMIDLSPVRRLRQHLDQNPQLWLGPLVVVMLLLSMALAHMGSLRQLKLLFFLPTVIDMVWSFLRWLSFSLADTAVVGMVFSFYGPGGSATTIVLVALLLGLWAGVVVTAYILFILRFANKSNRHDRRLSP